jgi:hypothetical protein
MKLSGMSVTLTYHKSFVWHECNGSWVYSTERNTNSNFNRPSVSNFCFLAKMILLRVVYPFKTCQHTNVHGTTLNDASLYPHQNFERPSFWMVKATGLESMASRSPSMAWIPYGISYRSTNCFKVIRGYTDGQNDSQTEWLSHKLYFPFQEK